MGKTSQSVCSDYYPEDTGDLSLRNVDSHPPGHSVTAQTTRQNLHHHANLKSCTEIIFCLSYIVQEAALLNRTRMERLRLIKSGPVNRRGKEFTRVAECIASIHGYRAQFILPFLVSVRVRQR